MRQNWTGAPATETSGHLIMFGLIKKLKEGVSYVNRPVVIVDPLSAEIELATPFKARGIPAIAVMSSAAIFNL